MHNRLATETSPYLRQHGENPVAWWPWNEIALAAAREQNKPILLSIGYSACHWCHVMAHESFEDESSARVMNELFICIKVDREERPDLDKIYQLAHQAMTGRGGGWPLTMFLAPTDLTPFYAGTYFPKDARHGLPPFVHVLEQVRAFFDLRHADMLEQNARLRDLLNAYALKNEPAAMLDAVPIGAAIAQIQHNFDPINGGHRGSPKFPHCAEMELLLDVDGKKPGMVDLTLARIAQGGIHDQIGGGFCRYSVDARWEIPHFEKMLYDNAQLLALYALRASATGDALFESAARGIVFWLKREMRNRPDAGSAAFHAALDADSDGQEGKFYVWHADEVRAVLSPFEFAAAARHFGLDQPPNFEHAAWNLKIAMPIEGVATALGTSVAEVTIAIASARTKLLNVRELRVRPGIDDKVLTAWNALLISALARSSRALRDPMLGILADECAAFLHSNLWRDNRLYASFAGGIPALPAYLDDYAYLLDALLELMQVHWSSTHLAWAIALADDMLERFEDREHGGFWFTANDHEVLLQRPKSYADDAIPAGNGIAARALLRLGHLVGDLRYIDAAEHCLRAAFSTMQQMPHACTALQRALHDWFEPRALAIFRYDNADELLAWREALEMRPGDRADIYCIKHCVTAIPPSLAARAYVTGGCAYLCHGTHCLPPITRASELRAALDQGVATTLK